MPDEKRNVGDGLASGVNPNVGYETRRYVFRSFDALDENVADKPRRYVFFVRFSRLFVASGFMPDEEKASGMNPDATDRVSFHS